MRHVLATLTTALADRYRVERELGHGGMATVYLARDLRHDRDVAIKVLHPDLGAALGGDRFLGEIRTRRVVEFSATMTELTATLTLP
jgi:serine/threonine-protein kinase